MQLRLENIGKIKDATIDIKGISVIAGENNTGKSTVGKVLFTIFNSLYHVSEKIMDERIESINRIISRSIIRGNSFSEWSPRLQFRKLISQLSSMDEKEHSIAIKSFLNEMEEKYGEDGQELDFKELQKKIQEILDITDEEIFKNILSKSLNAELDRQINNIYATSSSGVITLRIKKDEFQVKVSANKVENISSQIFLNTEAIYIDNPFSLDRIGSSRFFGSNHDRIHQDHLIKRLEKMVPPYGIIDEMIVDKKISGILEKINAVVDGDIISVDSGNLTYNKNGSETGLNIVNLSAGLKTFMILKMLLQNGILEENGTLILDEPEIHLHPQWQLLFAEIIVLIQKEFNMHILMTTHSPYFLNAIEVFSAKHQVSDKCKYYLASDIKDSSLSEIEDVTEDIEQIYLKLATPLQQLEDLRAKYVESY